ncbi:TraR/DksA C4-type zinc finger protein [Herbaspirillum sp. RV1423]|uniref:TraR/DksA family transcriptional regulator n=1 Tax=Herbaspirillum sp. RV1423 TaxID=1443993 RepID=UPI000555ACD3|nr:TraR/DksA C4-type zinc finger protein [Herbaspirillum sp. RV1423]
MAYPTEKQLTHLRELLDKQETAVLIRARVNVPDDTDSCDTTDAEDTFSNMEFAELADIEAAKKRMSEGQYGLCTECGCTIAYARLEAYPTAKRCTHCQRLHEQHRR